MNTRVIMICVMLVSVGHADAIRQTKGAFDDKFRQLDVDLPTPNDFRAASGAPGASYWQQKADYRIEVSLDADSREVTGSQTITYSNASPDTLHYLWVQLDQNRFARGSLARRSETAGRTATRRDGEVSGDKLSYGALRRHYALGDVDYGFRLTRVARKSTQLSYTVVDTMMRVDLPEPLAPGESTRLDIDWTFSLIDEQAVGGRSGYETFDDGTELYFAAQWFPRMAAYTDYGGWENKSFLGRGEFTLEFGDYDVRITVPSNHIVSATGELVNPRQVLTSRQRRRLAKARASQDVSDDPVFVVTPEEAVANQGTSTTRTKTWHFRASDVRDFAWASSSKFIWDARGFRQHDGADVLVMSFYPMEAEPLWSRYSTHAVIHAMEVYSRFSFPYPYPTAQSVNTWARGGMEYPMITFNGYRPDGSEESGEDRTWSRATKYGLIGVIIHEIGHIYFPMVVNSDERQWTWMDEGINTFLEYVAELEWEEKFPAFGGEPNVLDYITGYMTSSDQVPIMTQSDSILQFGPNAYSKPTAALTILRETVMGRDLFDHALRTYARRWRFRRPTPSDFFRTMEDASGIDLDWFWRGWFYTTDHVDVGVSEVREYTLSNPDPDIESAIERDQYAGDTPEPLGQKRNREEGLSTYVARVPQLRDFYNDNDRFTVSNVDRNEAAESRESLEPWEREALERALANKEFIYFIDFENIGGLVTPLPLTLEYEDGTTIEMMIPAEIWRRDPERVTKLIISDRKLVSVALDAEHRIADADRSNNRFPQVIAPSRLEVYKSDGKGRNLMADMLIELDSKEDSVRGSDVTLVPLQQ